MEACAENLESVLKRELERRYPGCQVKFHNVQKNNGLMLRGVVIAAPGDNIVPAVYIDEYLAKGYSAGEICEEVSRLYEENRDTGTLETDLTDFEAVCKKICFKLINAELNEDFLKTAPHRRLRDLAVVYYILLDDKSDGMATVPIGQLLASCWGVDEEELYTRAVENTRKLLQVVVTPMEMILAGMQGEEGQPGCEVITAGDFTMTIKKDAVLEAYVMSNRDKTFGAAAILYPDILRQISECLGADLYILPSSTHEVILMPDNAGADAAELLKMVCEVNRKSVLPEEFLADNVYHYDREEDAVTALH
ncbi:MAG: hypothetical protein HDR11_11655 [Lachnospiraceae bacterium]|nr:hypothetical protein [Lachnospiraceae bacterium]